MHREAGALRATRSPDSAVHQIITIKSVWGECAAEHTEFLLSISTGAFLSAQRHAPGAPGFKNSPLSRGKYRVRPNVLHQSPTGMAKMEKLDTSQWWQGFKATGTLIFLAEV